MPAASLPQPLPAPVVTIADAKSLTSVMRFGAPYPGMTKRGDIWWRANVDPPRHALVDQVRLLGYDPVFLHLTDGRCFKVQMDGDLDKLTHVQVSAAQCPSSAPMQSPWPAPVPRPGMRYVGRAWDLDAWADKRSGDTMLVLANHQDEPPLLSTSMRVIGVGGLGAPDAPMTEVTLVGYVGRQLTIATVMLYYP